MSEKKPTLPADYKDARGSNAGDEFHELWAVRKALALLERHSGLSAISLEGVSPEADATEQNTWAGVDCGLYYGSDNIKDATRIEIEQLKYSGADPQAPWTTASLTKTTRAVGNNSILRKLADAFRRLVELRGGSSNGVVLRLVSNKPVDPDVIDTLRNSARTQGGSHSSERDQLIKASGLTGALFASFAEALDLSSRTGSRFAIEEDVLRLILTWTDDDTRVVMDRLRSFVGKKMLPEAKGELIVAETVLQQFNFASWAALFPCPQVVKRIIDPVGRAAVSAVVQRMVGGDQRVCLHGGAGCGKTTALQEIESELPNGSAMVIFDCYGAGRYLNSDSYRHRPKDAFLQLSNELASRLKTPLLLSQSAYADYPRAFSTRLKRAAEAVAITGENALLVLGIDAADNAVIAAESLVPQEHSFVHDVVSLGDLPRNVRLLITARTSRLDRLNLPFSFAQMKLDGFTAAETNEHARKFLQDLPQWWIHDFYQLSDGNPRVQAYAIEYGGGDPTRTLNYLRPTGKVLNQIFLDRMSEARMKTGSQDTLDRFCEALITLPRPIPWQDLSEISGFSITQAKELSEDLAPGIRVVDNHVGFADEDFEDFVRVKVQDNVELARVRVAEWFMGRRQNDQYAAAHVADALYHAGRGKEIINLLEDEPEPVAIRDPLLRREVQLQRVRIGTRVSTEHADNVGAVRAILAGAEAIKTDAAIRQLVVANPDVAARFMRERAAAMILLDPKHVENHGPLLFHLLLEDAKGGNPFGARENFRQLRAWMARRSDDLAEKRDKFGEHFQQAWEISVLDVAAEVESSLLLGGIEDAIKTLHRWKPAKLRLSIARSLVSRLITSKRDDVLRDYLERRLVREPWNLLILVPLALSGADVDIKQVECALEKVARHHLARPALLRENWNDEITAFWLDTIVTACEVVFARRGNRQSVLPVLRLFAQENLRRDDRLFAFNSNLVDLLLRAHTLLEQCDKRASRLETFLVNSAEPSDKQSNEQRPAAERERREELASAITPLLPIYNARAQILVSTEELIEIDKVLTGGLDDFRNQAYRFSRRIEAAGIRRQAALAILKLLCLKNINASLVLSSGLKVFGDQMNPFGRDELSVFSIGVLRHDLHPEVLKNIIVRADEIAAMRIVAEDKISATLELSRFLVPISPDDAEALFTRAHSMTEETDVDAAYQLKSLAALLTNASRLMSSDLRLESAADFMSVVTDAAIRLSEQEHFPWQSVMTALTTVNFPVAVAAVARWEDSGVVDRWKCLRTLFTTALSQGSMTPTQVTALTTLLDSLEVSLVEEVVHRLPNTPAKLSLMVIENLARDELLRFGRATQTEVVKCLKLAMVGHSERSVWLEHLDAASRLVQSQDLGQAADLQQDSATPLTTEGTPLESYLWLSSMGVAENIRAALKREPNAESYRSTTDVLRQLETVVPPSYRIPYLGALASLPREAASDFEIADGIVSAVNRWRSPAVDRWCREELPRILIARLPGFGGWLEYPEMGSPVVAMFELVPRAAAPKVIIEGIAKNVDNLSAPVIYELTKLISERMSSEDCTAVLASYLPRIVGKIPSKDLDRIQTADVPRDGASAIARFLFAFLSDIDVRIRWRAAHAIRRLARLEENDVIAALLDLYPRTIETTFRAPKAPFYWLAARLWLMIAVDRIAHEAPSALQRHGSLLLRIATEDIPHVLIRGFAKDALIELVNQDVVDLSPKMRRSLDQVNASSRKRTKPLHPYGVGSGGSSKTIRERRFHFDVLDTTRYWYEPACRVFADVTEDAFLDIAETWIVERWKASPDVWKWDEEPRRYRLSEHQWQLWSHSHGSEPTLERYSTYLEWHAMFCAVGELLEKSPLAAVDRDYYGSFEYWLEGNQLTYPPHWLADLRAPKPAEMRFWQRPPADSLAWIRGAEDEDFLREIGIGCDRPGMLIVDAYHNNRIISLQETVHVSTAFVQPEVALALVRALQTTDEPHNYKIPVEDDDLEINDNPYRLIGWLRDGDSRSGIDQGDPFRNQIGGYRSAPSARRVTRLKKLVSADGIVSWQTVSGKAAYLLQEWSDTEKVNDESRADIVGSDGMRLLVSVEELQRVLNETGFDMIAEVEVTRKKVGRDYERPSQEEAVGQRYDRVFLLRKNGTIEAAEGRIGAWLIHRQ